MSYLPQSATVPSPLHFLGRIAGAPGEFVDSAKAYAYCRALAAASPRVRVFTIGHSEEGREILMLAIADENGIRDLDRLKSATAALADPRRTDPAAAERLIANARPIYYFNAALHSDETGSTEAMLEMAYRLAVSEQPMFQRIRQQLVVLINPVSNPDGRDKVVEWFYRYLKGKTDRDTLPRQSPPYWSKYAFVDINRDTHQQTHETTKAVHRMFHEWHPTVVHDLHEGSPFLMTWNGTGPYNPNIDPITYTEFLELSFHEVQTLTAMGMPGVSTWNFGEAFAHLYLDSVAMNHNSIGRGYETWGNGTAETLRRTVPPTEASMEWYRPLPPPAGEVTWSARDNLNYQETAALAALDYSAGSAKAMLRNFYKKGWDSWQKGLNEPPYAFLIPDGQGDRTRVAQMVGRLLGQHIEVGRAQQELKLKDGDYPAGTYVVRLDQPYRNYAVDLLTPQRYPKDGSEPYDDVSWELPAHYHLQAIPTADPAVRSAALTPLTEQPHPAGDVAGAGPVFLVKDTGQEELLAARYRLAGFNIEVAEHAFAAGGTDFPAGSWILPAQNGLIDAVRSTANDLGLDFTSAAAVPDVPRHAEKAARIGVWVPWADTDSIGWLRYSLDQRKVPYTYLRDEDIRAGGLRDRVDVVLYGHVDLELAEQIQGLPKAWGPMPFKKTPQTPELRHARGVGRHHRRHRMGRSRTAATLRRGRRIARDAGQRIHASAGRRHGARRSPVFGRCAAQHPGRRSRFRGSGTAGSHAHSGRACARDFRSTRSSPGLRLPGADLCVPPELPAVRCAAALAAHGLLHHLPRWPRGPQPHRHGMGRSQRSAIRRKRPGLGRGPADRTSRHSRYARGPRPCGRIQLQSDPSRPQSRRSASAVECDS